MKSGRNKLTHSLTGSFQIAIMVLAHMHLQPGATRYAEAIYITHVVLNGLSNARSGCQSPKPLNHVHDRAGMDLGLDHKQSIPTATAHDILVRMQVNILIQISLL